MSSSPSLPPELVDEIIDRLADDVQALNTCTMVSKAWISRSRYHLFSRVRVRGSTDAFLRFARIATCNGDGDGDSNNNVHGNVHGLSAVRVLTLDGRGLGKKPRITVGTIHALLNSMPYLRELQLTTLSLDDAEVDQVRSPKPRCLDVLKLVSVDAHHPHSTGSEFLALLSLFADVDTLFLRFVHFNRYPPTCAAALAHPSFAALDHPHFPSKLAVRHLHLHLPKHTAFFLELAKRTHTRRTLTSLTVTSRTTEKFEAIGAFCNHPDVAHALCRLEIDLKFCIPQNTTDILLLRSIARLRALEEITLSGLCLALNTLATDFTIFGIILPVVSAAPPSTTLFTVVLLLMEPPEHACRIFERDADDPHVASQWERLESAALDREKSRCRDGAEETGTGTAAAKMGLNVIFRSPFFALGMAERSIARIEDCIRREMPTLSARGLLTLRFEEEYNF